MANNIPPPPAGSIYLGQTIPESPGPDQDMPIPEPPAGSVPFEAPPPAPEEPDMFDRMATQVQKRAEKVQRGSEMYSAGEISYPEFALRGAGFAIGTLYDIVGEGVGTLFSEMTPDEIEDAIKQAVAVGGNKLMNTQTAQKALAYWNSLSQRQKDNIGDVVDVGSFVSAPVGVVGKTIKKSGLNKEKNLLRNELLDPSVENLKNTATELGRDDLYKTYTKRENEILNTALSIKGVGSGRTRNANMKALNAEISRISGQIRKTLRQTEKTPTLASLNAKIDQKLDAFLKDNNEYATDFYGNYNDVIESALQTAMKEFNGKGDSLLDVRRKFDSLVKNKFNKEVLAGDHNFRPLASTIRDAMNEYMQSIAPKGTDIQALMRRQHHAMIAVDNLGYNMVTNKTVLDAIKEWPKQHPYLTLGTVGGTGMVPGMLTGGMGEGLMVGGAAALGAYGATRPVVRQTIGGALENVPVVRSTALGGLGPTEEDVQP